MKKFNYGPEFLKIRVLLQSLEASEERIRSYGELIGLKDEKHSNDILRQCDMQKTTLNSLKEALAMIFEYNGTTIEKKGD